MSYAKSLAIEAKELRTKIERERAEAERISAERPALEAEAEHFAELFRAGGGALPARAGEVTARRSWIASRLAAIEEQARDDEQRLLTITSRLDAPARAEQARANVREASEWIAAAQRRRDAHAAAVDRLRAMQEAHEAQAVERVRLSTASILSAVGLDEGDTPPGDYSAADAAAHAQQGLAIAQAMLDALAKLEALDADLHDARKALTDAHESLATSLAAVAEMRHAEALAEYLPALAEYSAAHEVAHGWRPKPPNFGEYIGPVIDAEKEAFRASLDEPKPGPVAKAARAVRGVFA